MSKYRKKPIVVEAFQYNESFVDQNGKSRVPQWIVNNVCNGTLFFNDGFLYIRTLEGNMHVPIGNYIVMGVRGELYGVEPNIFAETYEEMKE